MELGGSHSKVITDNCQYSAAFLITLNNTEHTTQIELSKNLTH